MDAAKIHEQVDVTRRACPGQAKLADPQQFANTSVTSLHLPFPLFYAYGAGFSELIGSWLVIT